MSADIPDLVRLTDRDLEDLQVALVVRAEGLRAVLHAWGPGNESEQEVLRRLARVEALRNRLVGEAKRRAEPRGGK